jgi:endonuclease/exonuclease/phosphatase family metal-dependent hydrolase
LNLGHGRGTASHQALLKRMRIQSNLDGIASVLRQEGPDIVGLQEADAPSWWSGGFDHVDYLAMRSEYPHRFHGRHRDIAQIRSGGGVVVDVVSVHVDFASRGRRRIQLGKMATELKRRDRPVVILGDLNCSWGREPTLRELSTRLDLVAFRPDADGLATFPHGRPKRRIDWILASRGTEYKRYEVISTPLSDHRAVVADLIIS